jgi:hypothetical protein
VGLARFRFPLRMRAVRGFHLRVPQVRDDLIVAVDTVGDARDFLRLGRPHVILVTHRHGDGSHAGLDRLDALLDDRVAVRRLACY